MRLTAITGAAAMAAALALVLSGCGSDTKTEPSTSTKASQDHQSSQTSTKAAPSTAKVAPRDEDAAGPNPTIASYIAENNIQEAPVKRGDPGSPTIDLPVPDGLGACRREHSGMGLRRHHLHRPGGGGVHAEPRRAGLEADRQRRPAEDHRPGPG